MVQKNHTNINNIIRQEFSTSFMNDSKWEKLLGELTNEFDKICLSFKLIYNDDIKTTIFISPDYKPFFIEPILFKEVEWIEFFASTKIIINKKKTKQYEKEIIQDLNLIENKIIGIGDFFYYKNALSLRLFAYK